MCVWQLVMPPTAGHDSSGESSGLLILHVLPSVCGRWKWSELRHSRGVIAGSHMPHSIGQKRPRGQCRLKGWATSFPVSRNSCGYCGHS